MHGYLFTQRILQALVADHLLKSLSIREASRFGGTHDLLPPLKAVGPDT